MAEHADNNAVPCRFVFVHGIGAHPRREVTRGAWTDALAWGMDRAGHPEVAKKLRDGVHEVHLAHYADLYRPPGAQGSTEPKLDGTEAALLIQLIDELIANVEINPEIGERDVHALCRARADLHPRTDSAQGAGQMFRFALTAMLSLGRVSMIRAAFQTTEPLLMVSHLRQVTRYLRRGEPDDLGQTLDQRIRARVAEAIAEQPAIVVAHSLGSIVAYEALHETSHTIPLLVTLGSPLGMPVVVRPRLLPTPPTSPSGVAKWLNVWDRDDPIAVLPDLQRWIGPNSDSVLPCSVQVESIEAIPHAATLYLRHADVGEPIAHATDAKRC